MKLNKISALLALSLLLFSNIAVASMPKDKQLVIISLDDIGVPLLVNKPKPDIQAPTKPQLISNVPTSTYNNTEYISIRGEIDSSVYVNGHKVGNIGAEGTLLVGLDTSGADGIKNFIITLKDNAGNISDALAVSITKVPDPKYNLEYKGLSFYHHNLLPEDYQLTQVTDDTFNALTQTQKLQVANKLLSTLFYGYPQDILLQKIDSGNFISTVYNRLKEDRTDKEWLENHITDDNIFRQLTYNEQESVNILTRFYAMKDLDKYFFQNWIAYILTQTIMFSPAYELDTSHVPNIENVYSRIVAMLKVDSGMRYITYVHMMSEDNWRRFRSPEDNGREMLEIFHLDEDDAHVPIAGKALQNWRLDSDSDTLVVGLNENRQPLNLFGTIVFNGDDFYRELVKSPHFTTGITTRLVDYFFPNTASLKKTQIITSIIASKPETWQDIMLQIIFSRDYLLESSRVKSAEELFFSLAKKIDFKHKRNTFHQFKDKLEDMHQATMKYKLGKYIKVPLDTLSFSVYHKYIRERILLRKSDPNQVDNYDSWAREGWSESFIDNTMFTFNEPNVLESLDSFVTYLFNVIISRNPTMEELTLFRDHMTHNDNNNLSFDYPFNIFQTYSDPEQQRTQREKRKKHIAYLVLDYLSRLTETYTQIKVR